ncbi:NAD(P)/FAD-dependent oxidoreductase [Bosea psychrotolerans]|uniref:Glycine/D-amino acid oxidase-like deaminating enzyme n=1 Tax=Bosea psychrotolerans TaxID=1871628 RepID=A0A2S4M3L0_9HYPH|nr:FAD-binding oxidoreductase [Bosea psychrotolerans]POR49296.1 glycine/D-amino acid oxidase-like deaminating enzyme [Bosea psychrotolerans]
MTDSPYVTWPPSLWAATAQPGPVLAALEGDVATDVVVIGAGFTGLSTAIHLREAGIGVVVLEAAEPGWGASGRNNGQVIPTLAGHDPSAMIKRHGAAGERFNAVLRDSAQYLFDLIGKYDIPAEAEQAGWVQPVHSPGRFKLAEKRVREWSAIGAPVELLDRAATAEMLGSQAWFGGFWNPTGGHINPLALTRGLAEVAMKLGAVIHARSPATAMAHESGRWRVKTARGSVTAPALVLATNAYTGEFEEGLAPGIANEVIPVLSWQMATKPLSDNIAKTVIPARQAMSDTHRELYFARWDARNRLVTGGAAVFPGAGGANLRPAVAERLKRLWPQLGDVEFDYVWSGYVGMTPDNLLAPQVPGFPRIHRLGPNGFGWVGCNGRAVALSISLGRELARAAQGVAIETLGLPLSEPRPQPFRSIVRRIAPLALPLYRRLDAAEI